MLLFIDHQKGNLKDLHETLIDDVLSDCLDEPIVILDEFNVHVNDETASSAKPVKDISFVLDLVQNVFQTTHNKGKILDLMTSNTSAILKYVHIDEKTSDHFFTTCSLESIVIYNKRKLNIFRTYAKVLWEILANDLTLTLSVNDHIIDLELKSEFLEDLLGQFTDGNFPQATNILLKARFLIVVYEKLNTPYRNYPNSTNRLNYREKIVDSKLAFASKKLNILKTYQYCWQIARKQPQ